MTRHVPWYMKGLKSASIIKNRLSKIETYKELEEIIVADRVYLHVGDKSIFIDLTGN